METQEQEVSVPINLKDAMDIVCDKCGNYTFQNVFLIKRISALLSPTGKAGIIPISTFACNSCGNINTEFLPKPKGE